jgi:ferritin-like metal-binding protein YciE
LRELAKQLGFNEAVGLLEQTLEEEKATDAKLSRFAETVGNPEAKAS